MYPLEGETGGSDVVVVGVVVVVEGAGAIVVVVEGGGGAVVELGEGSGGAASVREVSGAASSSVATPSLPSSPPPPSANTRVAATASTARPAKVHARVLDLTNTIMPRVSERSERACDPMGLEQDSTTMPYPKDDLHRYLQVGRRSVLWKLEGLSEYDARRPLVPTGTNLLGLVKHLASVELGYFGETFGRPHGESLPWWDDAAEPNADMWATPNESREEIVALYQRAGKHSDATIEALDLDSPGRVPWWPPERAQVTLHLVLVHVTTETHRHAGHADVVRELIDGSAGLFPGRENLPDRDQAWWAAYRDQVEQAAKKFK